MKKILIIGTCFFPIPAIKGGAIQNLVDEYLKYNSNTEKYNITLYSPWDSDLSDFNYDKYNNVEFRYINLKNNNFSYKIKKMRYAILRRLLKNIPFPNLYCLKVINDLKSRNELSGVYDLVIVENEIDSIPMYKKKLKYKLVEHLHNDYINVCNKKSKKIVKKCDEIWGVSKFITNRISEVDSKTKLRVLYNGIDIKKFQKNISDKEKINMKSKLNINNKDLIVIYSGRIMPEKGCLELAKAFNKLNKSNIKLIIVGGLRDNTKKLQLYNEKLNFEINKSNGKIIRYGYANIDELRILYSISDIQVVPSIWEEAFGLIVIEGAISLNSLIVTDSGGMVELVDSDSALIISRNELEKNIFNSLLKLIDDNKMRTSIARNAYKNAMKFDISNYNKELEKYIDEL